MKPTRKTIFVSDIHLQASQPALTNTFLQLLKEVNPDETEAIYLLGDLFEAWIGDDDTSDYNKQIFAALSQATARGVSIYFIHGNRDFLIGKRFAEQTGCCLIKDETVVTLNGDRILLMHGDALCTADKAYVRSRKWMRNRIIQGLFLLLPLSIRRKIADNMRAASSHHMQHLTSAMMDVTQDAVTAVMQKHNVQYLIHGHTHKPDVHQFELNGQLATRIVLPAWHGDDIGKVYVWGVTK